MVAMDDQSGLLLRRHAIAEHLGKLLEQPGRLAAGGVLCLRERGEALEVILARLCRLRGDAVGLAVVELLQCDAQLSAALRELRLRTPRRLEVRARGAA
jgi:hypothetical protein